MPSQISCWHLFTDAAALACFVRTPFTTPLLRMTSTALLQVAGVGRQVGAGLAFGLCEPARRRRAAAPARVGAAPAAALRRQEGARGRPGQLRVHELPKHNAKRSGDGGCFGEPSFSRALMRAKHIQLFRESIHRSNNWPSLMEDAKIIS
eukprot:6179786-Pleurochrysis_carterae.AAC.2